MNNELNQLIALLHRIVNCQLTDAVNRQFTDSDRETLRESLNLLESGDLEVKSQFTKFIVNIGEGKDNHIGDNIFLNLNEEAVKALLEFLAKKHVIPNNLPRYKASNFVGRTREINDLHEQLQNNKQITVITGMGGIGKTELAKQYAQSYKDKSYLGGVCWLDAISIDLLGNQIVEYASANFKIHVPETWDVKTKVSFIWVEWQRLTSENILIVFDDVSDYDSLKSYFPSNQNQFKIIITTRIKPFSDRYKELNLLELSEESALELPDGATKDVGSMRRWDFEHLR